MFVTGFESPIQALVVFSDPKHEVDARLVRAREAARSYPLGRAREIRVLPSNEVIPIREDIGVKLLNCSRV